MAPVAARLSELLGRPVATTDDCVGPAAAQAAAALKPGDVLLLENLRFHAEETGNDAGVRAAAGGARRRLRQRRLRHGAPGARLHGGRHALPALRRRPADDQGARGARAPAHGPRAAVRRGARRPQGLGQDRRHPPHAHGRRHGAHRRRHGQRVPRRQGLRGRRVQGRRGRGRAWRARSSPRPARRAAALIVPTDVVVAREAAAGAPARVTRADGIAADEMALDIGPRDHGRVRAPAARAPAPSTGTGPWACSRSTEFAAGTKAVGEAIASAASRSRWPGGGDTVSAVRTFGLEGRLTHVSTGGGASMEFLEGRALPGVEALMDKTTAATTAGRRPLMAGNWKMYKTPAQTKELLQRVPAAGGRRRGPRRAHLSAHRRLQRPIVRRRHADQGRRPDHALRGRGRLHR